MDLEDLFKQKYHHKYKRNKHAHYPEHHHGSNRELEWMLRVFGALRRHKLLLAALVMGVLVLLVACIALLVYLIPVAGKAAGYVSQNNIQGFLDQVLNIAQRLLQGNG